MRTRVIFQLLAVCGVAMTAHAATQMAKEPQTRELPMAMFGSFWIENPLGSIDVTGVDGDRVVVTAVKTVFAADKSTLKTALEQCTIGWEGDERVRLIRTIARPVANSRCTVDYTIRMPRTSDLKIAGRSGEVRIQNMNGSVTVKSYNSAVFLNSVSGATAIEITNGRIVYELARTPTSNSQMTIVNGNIDLIVPADSNFEWLAETLAGDILTTLPVRGTVNGTTFHGHVNAPGGPLLNTQSVLGQVRLIGKGQGSMTAQMPPPQPRSVRTVAHGESVRPPTQNWGLTSTRKIQIPIVGGTFAFVGEIADLTIGEIKGPARVAIDAGQIDLGVVYGDCNVRTGGGPISLGEILGNVQARTGGGDILVRAARVGGDIRTTGGVIRVLYTGGPTTLESGGGDIIVRQAAGPISALTPSGDISLTMDPSIKTQKVDARTLKGNIILNVTPRFAADIDATILTSDPDANAIHSDFTTLSVRKERVGSRTRIRATGKINGGGERVELFTEGGDISITTQAPPPVSVISTPPGN